MNLLTFDCIPRKKNYEKEHSYILKNIQLRFMCAFKRWEILIRWLTDLKGSSMKIHFKLLLAKRFECLSKFPYCWKIHNSDKIPHDFSVESEYESTFTGNNGSVSLLIFTVDDIVPSRYLLFAIVMASWALAWHWNLSMIRIYVLIWGDRLRYIKWTRLFKYCYLFIWNPCSWNARFNNQYYITKWPLS